VNKKAALEYSKATASQVSAALKVARKKMQMSKEHGERNWFVLRRLEFVASLDWLIHWTIL